MENCRNNVALAADRITAGYKHLDNCRMGVANESNGFMP
jgi:hypothetical protein